MLETAQPTRNLTDADFVIGYIPSDDVDLCRCAFCSAAYLPDAGYHLFVVWDDGSYVWCCRQCALPYAPKITGLLLEAWKIQAEQRPRA